MVNRKKRLAKGIVSIKKQIKIHEEKLENAQKKGLVELEEYYVHEIDNLGKVLEQKKKMIEKS